MSMTDPIADFLTRIRNAIQAGHRRVDVPASGVKRRMAEILYEQKFIRNFVMIDDGKQGVIRIFLKFDNDGKSIIHALQRISTPGRRQYVEVHELPRVKNNMGIALISTSKGIMTERQAKRENVGGEVLCYVW